MEIITNESYTQSTVANLRSTSENIRLGVHVDTSLGTMLDGGETEGVASWKSACNSYQEYVALMQGAANIIERDAAAMEQAGLVLKQQDAGIAAGLSVATANAARISLLA